MRGYRGRPFRGRSRGRRPDDFSSYRQPDNSAYSTVVRALRDLFPDQGALPRDVYREGTRGGEHRAQSRRPPPRQSTHSRSRMEGHPRSHSRRHDSRLRQNHSNSRPNASRHGGSSAVTHAGNHRDGYTRPPNPRYEASSAALSSGRFRPNYNDHFPPIHSTRPPAPTRAPPIPPPSARSEPHPPPTHQTDAPGAALSSGRRNENFQSANPDFRQTVRHFNNGARLQHAAKNWDQVPVGVQRAINKVANSIKPPLADEALRGRINQAADSFSHNIQRLVSEHVTSKYISTTRSLAQLEPSDRDQARAIARRQILRSNTRVSQQNLEDLLQAVGSDADRHQDDWNRVGTRDAPRYTTPPAALEIPLSNRFAALEDEASTEEILAELNTTMPLEEQMDTTTSKKRAARSSPPVDQTPHKRTCAEQPTFRVPTALPQRVSNPCPSRDGSGSPQVVREEVVVTSDPSSVSGTAPSASARPPLGDRPETSNSTSGVPTATAVSPAPTGQLSVSVSGLTPSGYVTPLPSPINAGRPIRLSMFAPKDRDTWSIPEIMPDEDTLLITDSNGGALARHTPLNWRVAGFRGGHLHHVNRLLEKFPIPPQVTTLIVAMGLNDRAPCTTIPLINTVTRLQELLQIQPRRTVILGIPQFNGTSVDVRKRTTIINQHFRDLLAEQHNFIDIPESLTVQDASDGSHYPVHFAGQLVRHLTTAVEHLN